MEKKKKKEDKKNKKEEQMKKVKELALAQVEKKADKTLLEGKIGRKRRNGKEKGGRSDCE